MLIFRACVHNRHASLKDASESPDEIEVKSKGQKEKEGKKRKGTNESRLRIASRVSMRTLWRKMIKQSTFSKINYISQASQFV